MIELLPWLTLIVIGGLFYLTAVFSEPTEPSYSAMDVLLVFPMLIKLLYYALERAAAPAFGLLALIGVLPTAAGCIQIRLQRKRDAENRLYAPKIDDAVIRSIMHHRTEDSPEDHTD